MNRIIRLPDRLKAIAGYIDEGAAVLDTGTDHGYLPVYLAQTGRAHRIFASDISAGSLASAQRNAAKYGVAGLIRFIHAPGLTGVAPADIDTCVIAGVGGETILGILADAQWTAGASGSGNLKLILQPQTKLEVLRDFLRVRGYNINSETTVTDRGRLYTILVI